MASSPSSSLNNKVNIMDPKTANQQHQDPLKCPRCDSSNTKFCYYNNYSLSQPRHFCKACKRYWTRGGTLRSVPVGGSCRKNKRVKRPPPPSNGGDGISVSSAAANTATTNPNVQSRIDLSPNSSHINNPLFYSHLTNPNELNFPFSSFRVSSDHNGGLDFQHHMNGLGLGFSSSGLMEGEVQNNDPYKNVNTTTGNYNSMFFASSNFAATSTMASLLASGLQHQKFNGLKDIHESANYNYLGLMPYDEETQMGKEVKIERENRLDQWNPDPNPIQQINGSDPSALVWNTSNLGAWFDPSNMGSSVPSLI